MLLICIKGCLIHGLFCCLKFVVVAGIEPATHIGLFPHAVNSPQGRVARSFDVESITRHAATANNMLQRGLRIPCPFAHHKEAVPVKSTVEPSPYNNAGYWELFSIRKNDKGKPALFGIIDLPGSDNEPDSPYYKAKNTAKEVSISIKPEYLDGTGTKWEDVIMHVALVNHPVVPDQEPFKDIPDGSLVVNMSLMETEDVLNDYSPGMIASIKKHRSKPRKPLKNVVLLQSFMPT